MSNKHQQIQHNADHSNIQYNEWVSLTSSVLPTNIHIFYTKTNNWMIFFSFWQSATVQNTQTLTSKSDQSPTARFVDASRQNIATATSVAVKLLLHSVAAQWQRGWQRLVNGVILEKKHDVSVLSVFIFILF